MKWNENECRELVAKSAYVVVLDGLSGSGRPQYVIRRVIRAFGLKGGRDCRFGVLLDQPLSDGSNGVLHGFVLGYNNGEQFDVSKLIRDAGNYYELVPKREKAAIVEAVTRQLREVRP